MATLIVRKTVQAQLDLVARNDGQFSEWLHLVRRRLGVAPAALEAVDWFSLFYGDMLTPDEAAELVGLEYDVAAAQQAVLA